MRTFWLAAMAAVFLVAGTAAFIPAEAGAEGFNRDVTLTEEQQKEMGALHREAFNKQKDIVNKYVEFNVLTKEKGEQIIAHFERAYKELEQNGFIPNWERPHHSEKQDN
ncbi:YckD family protein [Salipaludibacillus sp. CUR1]|uniref:YckD family protein n=1 Tax=Salipaludibacillus sp. CUR1 TaxID=2820003 RepID=UPI001E30B453|nr:YckD family protein [Salipaludibacillus sp. CUR1]MCE7792572.1 YckD family protein [Salipaludibacillus sp. CUR1]